MFLDCLLARNSSFVESAIALHQEGLIPANSYVIDTDTVEANTRHFTVEAHKRNLTVYAMSKQVGRAPGVLAAMTRGGIDGYVAVDMACARPIVAGRHNLGHLGHLVQIPQGETDEAAAMQPDYWTVFSLHKAAATAAAVATRGHVQKVLLRVWDKSDIFYPGHEGGFEIDELETAIKQINRMDGLQFAGITTFPALLFDPSSARVTPTPNVETLQRAADIAAPHIEPGVRLEVNAPGTTSTAVLGLLERAGATQVEPGHSLTGTTPLHAVDHLPEIPAALYLTEVAHIHQNTPLCFGGGFYVDPVFRKYAPRAIVAAGPQDTTQPPIPLDMPDPAGIDYYARLHPPAGRRVGEGDTVIAGFRIQAFVTRASVVAVSGVRDGLARVDGVWNVYGEPLTRDRHA